MHVVEDPKHPEHLVSLGTHQSSVMVSGGSAEAVVLAVLFPGTRVPHSVPHGIFHVPLCRTSAALVIGMNYSGGIYTPRQAGKLTGSRCFKLFKRVP